MNKSFQIKKFCEKQVIPKGSRFVETAWEWVVENGRPFYAKVFWYEVPVDTSMTDELARKMFGSDEEQARMKKELGAAMGVNKVMPEKKHIVFARIRDQETCEQIVKHWAGDPPAIPVALCGKEVRGFWREDGSFNLGRFGSESVPVDFVEIEVDEVEEMNAGAINKLTSGVQRWDEEP